MMTLFRVFYMRAGTVSEPGCFHVGGGNNPIWQETDKFYHSCVDDDDDDSKGKQTNK